MSDIKNSFTEAKCYELLDKIFDRAKAKIPSFVTGKDKNKKEIDNAKGEFL